METASRGARMTNGVSSLRLEWFKNLNAAEPGKCSVESADDV
jgi:hypothetical protein